jgi:hypothetical protein
MLIYAPRNWSEIDDTIPCPISFTEEEWKTHFEEGKGFNTLAEFWDKMDGYVQRDGWTCLETYEPARELFAYMRDEVLKDATGEERVELERLSRWASR